MNKPEYQKDDIVDAAIEALRDSPVPDGPPAELLSTLLDAGGVIDEKTRLHLNHNRKTIVKRLKQASLAAAVMIVAGTLLFSWWFDQSGSVAFAKAAAQIRNAKSATWTYVFVRKVSNEDKSKTWHQTNIHKAYYRAPGLNRLERLDENGDVKHVEIDDAIAGVHLEFWPKEKRARIVNRGPIAEKDRKHLSDRLSILTRHLDGKTASLGKKKIDGHEATGFRVLQSKADPNTSADLWVDAKTSELLYVLVPGAHKFDPETDAARNNPPGKRHEFVASALIMRDVKVDANLDDALFSLQPPAGYSTENKTKHEPTEKDVEEWFGILAECHEGLFPEKIRIGVDRINAILKKNRKTPAEKRILDHGNLADLGLVYTFPIDRFVHHSGGAEWHYAGKGVRSGDKTKAIFWYRPTGSKTFRVIYGDLSVKDVAAKNLPLPIDE
jgi:hypothetical protein